MKKPLSYVILPLGIPATFSGIIYSIMTLMHLMKPSMFVGVNEASFFLLYFLVGIVIASFIPQFTNNDINKFVRFLMQALAVTFLSLTMGFYFNIKLYDIMMSVVLPFSIISIIGLFFELFEIEAKKVLFLVFLCVMIPLMPYFSQMAFYPDVSYGDLLGWGVLVTIANLIVIFITCAIYKWLEKKLLEGNSEGQEEKKDYTITGISNRQNQNLDNSKEIENRYSRLKLNCPLILGFRGT